MLKLLLDEHISPDVALGVRRRDPAIKIYALTEWDGGSLIGQDDASLLKVAAAQGMTLVAYDRRTIPPLLKTRAEEGRRHGGVIVVDEKTISPADVGGLIRALAELANMGRRWNWSDRI